MHWQAHASRDKLNRQTTPRARAGVPSKLAPDGRPLLRTPLRSCVTAADFIARTSPVALSRTRLTVAKWPFPSTSPGE